MVNDDYDLTIKELLSLQPGDLPGTYADSIELAPAVGYKPATTVKEGVVNFVAWIRDDYRT